MKPSEKVAFFITSFCYTERHREAQRDTENICSVELCGTPDFLCVSFSLFILFVFLQP